MKRIVTLALAAGLFMGATAPVAEAAEFNVSGKFVFIGAGYDALALQNDAQLKNSLGTTESVTGSGFDVYQRFEMSLGIVASENLSGFVKIRAPKNGDWGNSGDGLGVGTGGTDVVALISAYVDWLIPSTDIAVRMGLQPIALPGVLGAPVLDDDVAAIVVDAPLTDNVSVQFGWIRTSATGGTSSTSDNVDLGVRLTDSYADAFFLVAPMKFDGFAITPWAAYLMQGDQNIDGGSIDNYTQANISATLLGTSNIWAGVTTEFSIMDPLTFELGFVYGSSDDLVLNSDGSKSGSSDGFVVDARLSYATDYGTPALFAWYGSGDDISDIEKGEAGRLPSISGGWTGSGVGVVSTYFKKSAYNIAPDSGVGSPAGLWGIGVSHSGFQPAEDWKLGGHIMYVKGTNDSEVVAKYGQGVINPAYLTDKDSLVEFAAYTTYDIYKDLQVAFELAYILQDIDTDLRGISGDCDASNAFRVTLGMQYLF